MFRTAQGIVVKILFESPELQELLVQIDGAEGPEKAYNYPGLYRPIQTGEEVLLNTTAVTLGLGTGGRHFIIPADDSQGSQTAGHIMKLRYTPWQFPVLTAEEDASEFHNRFLEKTDLKKIPVVIAPLHSMIPGIIAGFRGYRNNPPKSARIVYIMTDAAALPIALSHSVRQLKSTGLLQTTITTGHAFGGDLETVSIPSALAAAVEIGRADLIVCALGPGIVGTGTRLGFSGIEQSWVIDLVSRFHGTPIVCPRISTADSRERHQGLSHHTLTILDLANQPALVGISRQMPMSLTETIKTAATRERLLERHHWYLVDDPPAQQILDQFQLQVQSMGRNLSADPWFFQSSVTAGYLAATISYGEIDSLQRME